MSRWAAIVYGRTYEVDFRLLAIPHDLNRAEQDWTIAHIQVMTRSPEDLPGKPRWAVFKHDSLCVVGVACMARELIGGVHGNGENITQDQKGRPLYTFVGYAIRNESERVELPAYLHQDLSLFSSPYYQYVAANWLAKSYEERTRMAIPTEYQPLNYQVAVIPPELDRGHFALNLAENNTVDLWRDSEPERQYLWASAAGEILEGRNVSLCLGLARGSDAANGIFLNASASDVAQREKIVRTLKTTPVPVPDQDNVADERKLAPNQQPNTDRELALRLSISLLGGFAGLSVAKLLGFSAKKTVVSFLSGGVSGWILAVTYLLVKRKFSQLSVRKNEKISTSIQLSYEQNKMLGFKEKNEQEGVQEDEFMGWK